MKGKIIALIAVAVVIFGGWYMFRQSGTDVVPVPKNVTVVRPNPAAPEPSVNASKFRDFNISAGSYFFKPNSMTVNKGDTVRITVVNSGGYHDFVIDEFNTRTNRLQAGETETITFVANKSGTFEYYCSVGS